MNAIVPFNPNIGGDLIPYSGILMGGSVDGNRVTCESRKIATVTETRLLIDNGIKVQRVQGSYHWSDKEEAFVWELESLAFPERTMKDN